MKVGTIKIRKPSPFVSAAGKTPSKCTVVMPKSGGIESLATEKAATVARVAAESKTANVTMYRRDKSGVKASRPYGQDLGRVQRFRTLRSIRRFGGGRQSKEVCLLEGSKVVAKRFDRNDKKQVKAFHKEVRNFQHVKDCPFVPKLLAADPEQLVLYTDYCGERPAEYTKELKKQVREKVDRLRNKYHLTRNFHSRADGLPRLANVAIKNGQVKLIDMGPPFHPVK
jgi:hypothetical protein